MTNEPAGSATEQRGCGARGGSRGEHGGVVGWMSRHPLLLACAGLLLTAGLGVFAFDRNAENRYQRKLREIRARGEPTTVEELIAATPGLPDDKNAFIPLMKAVREFQRIRETDEEFDLLPWVGKARLGPFGTRTSADQQRVLRSYLDRIAPHLAEMERAIASGPGLYRPALATPMSNTLMPELALFRRAGKVLAVAALDAVERHDAGRAEAAIFSLIRLNRMLDGDRSIIPVLVRIATTELAHEVIVRAANSDVFSDAALARIASEISADDLSRLMLDGLVAARVSYIDTLAWLRTTPGAGTAFGPTMPGVRYVPGLTAINGAKGLELWGDLIEAVRKPGGEAILSADRVDASVVSLPWHQIYNRSLLPSYNRAVVLWMRTLGKQRAVLAALACEQFRLNNGGWPGSLESLTPEYVRSLPLDPFDGKPIRFSRTPEGIKVWSIGDNLVDDGGDLDRPKPPQQGEAKDWGWVILDPPLRGRPAE